MFIKSIKWLLGGVKTILVKAIALFGAFIFLLLLLLGGNEET